MLPGFGPSLGLISGAASAFPLVNIGTNTNTTGATLTLTSVNVGAGSLIIVGINEHNTTGVIGTLADTAGNTYTNVGTLNPNAAIANGASALFYCPNCLALSGGTITYTKNTSGVGTGISAFYSTVAATTTPLDTAVTASATGSSTTPSVTSGTPAVSGEMFVALLGYIPTTFTQAGGWTSPFASTGSGLLLQGGHEYNSGTGTLTYAPTLSVAVPWCLRIVGFKHK